MKPLVVSKGRSIIFVAVVVPIGRVASDEDVGTRDRGDNSCMSLRIGTAAAVENKNVADFDVCWGSLVSTASLRPTVVGMEAGS